MSLRLVFMGSPAFATPALKAVLDAGHDIAAVYTKPPQHSRRTGPERLTPVHELARRLGLAVFTPTDLRGLAVQEQIAAHGAQAAVVAAYGHLLPRAVLAAFPSGCYNLHPSLLPRWRGAAPVERAIMSGDTVTGACIMRLDDTLDTGAVCALRRTTIEPGETAGELRARLAVIGAELMTQTLLACENGTLTCQPQRTEGVTYADKIDKAETRIDFSRPGQDVLNHIHALSPRPGAWLELPHDGRPIRIRLLKATPAPARRGAKPGEVLDAEFSIACGDGAIAPVTLQRQGKTALPLAAFLRGFQVTPGVRIG